MARNLMDILNDAKSERERLTRNAICGPQREAYTTHLTCPKCGSQECSAEFYDGGMDWETGYHDKGWMGICSKCGLQSDVEDFYPQGEQTSTTREPEEFDREAPAHTEDREDTEELTS